MESYTVKASPDQEVVVVTSVQHTSKFSFVCKDAWFQDRGSSYNWMMGPKCDYGTRHGCGKIDGI